MNKIITILISAFLAGQTWAATVINVYPTNITTTSACFQATISTNGGGSTGTVFYGFSDQTTNASSWSWSNDYGNITTTGTVSKQITGLQQAQKYYYRWRILEAGTYVWAAGTSNFWTKAASPTSTPTPVSISVQANPTTAALMAPTNFFNANTGLLNTALSGLFATDAELAAESNRAVSVEQQLGAAVTNINTATNALNTRADALETSTGTLNTAVGNLQTSTGALNSAVSDLNAATGSLNSVVANILTATGALNTAVADLQISTGTLNSAVGNLNTATGSLNSAVGTLNTATNSLNTRMGNAETSTTTLNTAVGLLNTATNDLNGRVTDLEGGGSVAGWSGFAATQEVFWSYQSSISTNIIVTQIDATPNPAGTYVEIAEYDGHRQWYSVATGYSIWWDTLSGGYYMLGERGVLNWIAASGPEGTYNDDSEGTTGSASASYSVVTNISTWHAGVTADDPQGWKLSLGNTNLYRAYAASNVFDKPIYGDGANLSGVNATNAVTLAGLPASDYAKQANYAATSNLVDLTKSIADGLNSVSSMVNRVTTADYPALSNLVDSVKALVDGLNSESNNWHVAYTSVFHGAGSTGRVTSEAGDATKFLKGDGTWSDTPAAAYGTTDSTGYRGDWGAAVSNIATRVDANAVTNPVGANVNFDTKDATNIGVLGAASLQITGGSPTNGAVFVATNTAGKGAWDTFPRIFARSGSGQKYPTITYTNMYYTTIEAKNGAGTWDGTQWTPGRVGWIILSAGGTWDLPFTGTLQLRFVGAPNNPYKNIRTEGPAMQYAETIAFYSTNSAASYYVQIYHDGGKTYTNIYSWFSGMVQP